MSPSSRLTKTNGSKNGSTIVAIANEHSLASSAARDFRSAAPKGRSRGAI
jgi:hypothetical protein